MHNSNATVLDQSLLPFQLARVNRLYNINDDDINEHHNEHSTRQEQITDQAKTNLKIISTTWLTITLT